MAEGFEPYHVPQQSRRDKLRVVDTGASLAPLYDPSLICADFVSSANLHRQTYAVKEEGMNSLGFAAGMGSNNHMYADPPLPVHLNPSPIHDFSHVYRGLLDQPFHAAAVQSAAATAAAGLSLSLSSNHSNLNLPLELNLQRYDSPVFSSNVNVNGVEFSKSTVPLGPFTGYASVLRGSRFLKPAQQLLEELCDVGRGIYAEKINGVDSSLLDPPPLEGSEVLDGGVSGGDQTRKKSRLLSMLDEVYKRYKQYYQQMQAAVAAFESVAGLSNAAPFANLALKAMSKHFRCLKNVITDQLQFPSKSHGKVRSERDESRMESSGRSSYGQRPLHVPFVDQPVWRPQRGLPERAVTVLRAWLFEHFLHPYPTDTDKIMLGKQTGLSRNQVSNWFINARVRLWKPMVEEIHMLETCQGQKPSTREEEQQQPPNGHLPTTAVECESNASTSIQRAADFPLKRGREDPTEAPTVGQMKMQYESLLHHPHVGVGLSGGGGGNGGVSLTLGLQNGVGLPDSSYPMNAARRFGLETQGEGYVVSGFAAQNREFGRGIIDGQIMHDFVG